MLLNPFERIIMNNPLRAAFHRHVEARTLLTMGGRMPAGGNALEVGCGNGVGGRIIMDMFKARRLDAFDLDPKMTFRAEKSLARYGDSVRVFTGDVARIDAPDSHYDAVFDFGIIHHVPDWREALAEIFRVLKPGGRFYAEEMYRPFIQHPVWKRLLDHPAVDRFDHAQFNIGIQQAGLTLIRSMSLHWFGWHVADKLAVE